VKQREAEEEGERERISRSGDENSETIPSPSSTSLLLSPFRLEPLLKMHKALVLSLSLVSTALAAPSESNVSRNLEMLIETNEPPTTPFLSSGSRTDPLNT